MTLCNPGEGVLVGEWTYPSAMAAMYPVAVTPVPVALDSEGIRSDDLNKVLSEWDHVGRGMPR
jgi:aromatic amino acid aminotransferase I